MEASATDDDSLHLGLFDNLTIDLSTVWLQTPEDETPSDDDA